jgi:hypothetical protein
MRRIIEMVKRWFTGIFGGTPEPHDTKEEFDHFFGS